MLAGVIGFGLAIGHNPSVALQCQISASSHVALVPYTSHGRDEILRGERILNDETVFVLVEQARNQARAGADIIPPSEMMDGRVGAIRAAENFEEVQILSYAAKYASTFYGPFPRRHRHQCEAYRRQAHLPD